LLTIADENSFVLNSAFFLLLVLLSRNLHQSLSVQGLIRCIWIKRQMLTYGRKIVNM